MQDDSKWGLQWQCGGGSSSHQRLLMLVLCMYYCCRITTGVTAAPAPQCSFCPKAKTVTTFGAASAEDTEIARLGGLTQNEVFETVAGEGLQLLDLTVYKCEDWDRLPSVLASAMVSVLLLASALPQRHALGP